GAHQLRGLATSELARGAWRRVDGVGRIAELLALARAAVEAEVERHAVQPGADPRLVAAPLRRELPQPQEGILGDVLGLVGVAERAARERDDAGEVAARERTQGVGVAGCERGHEGIVRGVAERSLGARGSLLAWRRRRQGSAVAGAVADRGKKDVRR